MQKFKFIKNYKKQSPNSRILLNKITEQKTNILTIIQLIK